MFKLSEVVKERYYGKEVNLVEKNNSNSSSGLKKVSVDNGGGKVGRGEDCILVVCTEHC